MKVSPVAGNPDEEKPAPQRLLARGARLTELLKQAQFSPMKVEEQVVSIFAGTLGYLDSIPVDAVGRFEQEMLRTVRDQHGAILEDIRIARELKPETEKQLVGALNTFAKAFAA